MKTKTLNLYSLRQRIKKHNFNWELYFFVIIFLSGLIIGSFCVKNSESFLTKNIIEIYSTYIHQKNQLNTGLIFLNTFLLSAFSLIVSFFVGLCAIGIPLISAIPFLVGYVLGIISGYIYETYLLKGLIYCAIIIFPATVIACVTIIFSCTESMRMSKNMLFILANNRNQQQKSFGSYCIKHLIYSGICAIAAIIEAVLYKLFSALFTF